MYGNSQKMREIIYFQAGTLANFTGSHFWNTEESYLTYGETEEPFVASDLSFQETLTTREPTLCPRLLLFDRKANFGTLSRTNALVGHGMVEDDTVDPLWNEEVVEYRQEPVTRSDYQDHMDRESADESVPVKSDTHPPVDFAIRYWSDFSRVYYHPRSLHSLPDLPEYENVEGDWQYGRDEFLRYDQETALMEGCFRSLLEECDNAQGIQSMNDVSTFGSFTHSFLVSMRDELPKLPCITFPFLSDAIPGLVDLDDVRRVKKTLNDALYLRGVSELSSMTIPMQSPSTWASSPLSIDANIDLRNPYPCSAILSAHIETSTLPLRLKKRPDDMASFSSLLNWCGNTPIGHLSGIFPTTPTVDFDKSSFQFSAINGQSIKGASLFARRDVSRGFSEPDMSTCDGTSLREPFVSSFHLPAYPLPSSFPSFSSSAFKTSLYPDHSLPSAPMFSSITVTSGTAHLFRSYATFISARVQQKPNVMPGLDADEMKELSNDLWTLCDNYQDGSDMYGGDGE